MTRPSAPTALSSAQDAPRVTEAMVEARRLVADTERAAILKAMDAEPPQPKTLRKDLCDLRLRLEGACQHWKENGDPDTVAWLSAGIDAINRSLEIGGAANVWFGLWHSAEEEKQELEAALGTAATPEPAQAGEATVSEAEVEAALSELVVRVVSRSSYAVGELREVTEIILRAAARARAAAQGAGAQPVAWDYLWPDGSRTIAKGPERSAYERDMTPGYMARPLYAAPSPDASRAEVEAARREERERCFAAVRSVAMKPKNGDAAVEAHNAAIHDAEWAIRALGDRP